jgi:hypothetical protein
VIPQPSMVCRCWNMLTRLSICTAITKRDKLIREVEVREEIMRVQEGESNVDSEHTGEIVIEHHITSDTLHEKGNKRGTVRRAKGKTRVWGGVVVEKGSSVGLVKHKGIVAEADLVLDSVHALKCHEGLELQLGFWLQ